MKTRPPKKNPLVSVILPVFNGEAFLAEAVQSVLDQNYTPLEIIIVDDGSTDHSAQIAKRYGEPVRYFYQENAGPAAARNLGVQQAQGAFIAFIDADDIWAKGKQTYQMAFFERYPQSDIVQGLIERIWYVTGDINSDGLKEPDFLFPYTNLGSMTVRRAVFDEVGLFNTDLKYHEDTDFWLRAREANLVVAIQHKKALVYRIHGVNLTTGQDIQSTGFPGILWRSINRRRKSNPVNLAQPIPNWITEKERIPDGHINAYAKENVDRPTISLILHLTVNQELAFDAIRSIEDQDLQPDELIVVGKISDDLQSRLKKSYPDAVLIDTDSTDLATQINAAVQAAHCAWISFIGSDVEWPREKLQAQVDYAERHPDQTILVGNTMNVIDPAAGYPKAILDNIAFRKSLGDMLDTMMVKRDTLAAVGLFNPEIAGMEETDWLLRASDLGFTKTKVKNVKLFRYITPEIAFENRQTLKESLLNSVHDSILRKRQAKKSSMNQDQQ